MDKLILLEGNEMVDEFEDFEQFLMKEEDLKLEESRVLQLH
jgi:hypothetical protein